MTITTSDGTSAEHTVIREIFHSIAVKEMKGRSVEVTFQAVPQENTDSEEGWLGFVTEEMASLQWQETNLPDGRTPPEPKAAVGLISLLVLQRGINWRGDSCEEIESGTVPLRSSRYR